MLTQGGLTNSSASEVTPSSQALPQVPLPQANSVPTGASGETTPRSQVVSPVANTADLNCSPEETLRSQAEPPFSLAQLTSVQHQRSDETTTRNQPAASVGSEDSNPAPEETSSS